MKKLIVHEEPKSPISEAYRSVRTNIQFANIDNEIKTILFTSATKSEGKTTTISNVSLTLADAGYKVVVLDCDFRSPSIHRAFGLSNKFGATDILLKGKSYREHLHCIASHDNLDVITAGKIPSNPSELLCSNAMKVFIDKLKEDYDYVMIDTPPMLPVTDATVLATYIDGVIIVCASGTAEIEKTRKSLEALRQVDANIIGAVLNKMPLKQKEYNNYYYYSGEEKEHTLAVK